MNILDLGKDTKPANFNKNFQQEQFYFEKLRVYKNFFFEDFYFLNPKILFIIKKYYEHSDNHRT